ncbi:hypothetical protein DFJ74DRAFT_713067 [Hyaloraphidium curvatum]|nr:hypothetical protein DFJ74DRAFT_713067 [Hyaloraphidium curvatum]
MAPLDDFSPDEWLAILPAAIAPPFPGPGPLRVPADPAAAARSERLLLRSAMRTAIRSLSSHLAGWLDVQFFLAPFNARVGLRYGSYVAVALPLAAAPAVLNDGRFSARALGWGLAAYCVFVVLICVAVFGSAWKLTYLSAGAGSSGPRADADLGSHALAPLARWKQLVDLDCHVAGGERDHCGDNGIRFLFSDATLIMRVYTAFITFGRQFWTSWWGVLLAALYLCSVICANVLGSLGRISAVLPVMGLTERLHVRAMSLALGGLLGRIGGQLGDEDNAGAHEPGKVKENGQRMDEELYVRLHLLLSTVFGPFLPTRIGGLCIPVWALIWAFYVLILCFLDLSGIAAGNSQIRSVTALYTSAQESLRRMALMHPSHPLLLLLDRHDRMLGSLVRAEAYEMRFWGFAVGYGTVRTLAVTILTVVFGLWSIARGSGVYLTPETVCY